MYKVERTEDVLTIVSENDIRFSETKPGTNERNSQLFISGDFVTEKQLNSKWRKNK